MRLVLCEKKELKEPEVTIAYREMTKSVKRVADYVTNVDKTILCKKDDEEFEIFTGAGPECCCICRPLFYRAYGISLCDIGNRFEAGLYYRTCVNGRLCLGLV